MTSFRSLSSIIDEHGGIIQTGSFGSQLHESDYLEDGIEVMMPKDIKNGGIDTSSVARISEEKVNIFMRHRLKNGDIVFPVEEI